MPDRSVAPPFARSTSFTLLEPNKATSRNGAEVYFVLGGTQDVCKVELIFSAGRWFEKLPGASYFTAQLLSKGTTNKNSSEIAEQLDRHGAHLEINAGLDYVSISLYSLAKNLEPSLDLIRELLLESVFPQKELDQLKSIYLQNLKVNHEKTSYRASNLIRKAIYGENHPYGKESEEEDVNALKQFHLIDHYNQFFKTCTILISGKVSESHQRYITDIVSPLSFNQLEYNNDFLAEPKRLPREVIEKAGSIQSSIRIGKKIVGRSHDDYAGVLFLNHILGGYFGSRLMKNIREEKGLSYGISSGLHTMAKGNHLVIGADVNRENLNLTFDEIGKELKRLRTERVEPSELETARNHFIGSLQLEITTSFAHADKVKNILVFNLPQDFYQNLISEVDKISAGDLLRIAETYFSEDSFIEVAVG